jgi:hypothetical protein
VKAFVARQRDPFGNSIASPWFWVTAAMGAAFLYLLIEWFA